MAKFAKTPSPTVICMSWPQACITPSFVEANGNPVASVIGKASISARYPMVRVGFVPAKRTNNAVGTSGISRIVMKSVLNVSTTFFKYACVCVSCKASSGILCKSRRILIKSSVVICCPCFINLSYATRQLVLFWRWFVHQFP